MDAKVVFGATLKRNDSSIPQCHYLPYRNLLPSDQEKRLTRKLLAIVRSLDLPVDDHIILSRERLFFGR